MPPPDYLHGEGRSKAVDQIGPGQSRQRRAVREPNVFGQEASAMGDKGHLCNSEDAVKAYKAVVR